MEAPQGPFCQSCGMPLSQDEQGGGTKADGTRSAEYCSHCYQKGQFTEPGLTAGQMVAKVLGMLKQMGIPGPQAEMLAKGVPDLKRWKS
ncbi:MAG: zinc ribbon domain-containing protein [Dehalococcoidia bacterium]|nr:zinc ribbon domain-containing protein [Dehalococcoidia bacterium]